MANQQITAYVLAKDEAPNIGKCLSRLTEIGLRTIVLDSGSTDGTAEIAAKYSGVEVERFTYVDHATAYNWIIEQRTPAGDWAVILDADMEVTIALWQEIQPLIEQASVSVIRAPIQMYVEQTPLKTGSLCPAKAIVFRGGNAMFDGHGHGEKLRDGIRVITTTRDLIHDDRKSYGSYLLNQLRYADNFCRRSKQGLLSYRDRIRLRCPILAFIVPFYSYILKRGIFSGRPGAIYAVDRAIAELLQYRQALVDRMNLRRSNASKPRDDSPL
jgi:glycosyltransferase involved in cell wall biosynthesis